MPNFQLCYDDRKIVLILCIPEILELLSLLIGRARNSSHGE